MHVLCTYIVIGWVTDKVAGRLLCARLVFFVLFLSITGEAQIPYVPCRFDNYQLPIKADHTISFETDEGSIMNVDVSPDGKTLVFDLLGDLYTVPITGREVTQITRGIAVNGCPVWSPDGKYIAYISDASGSRHLTIKNIESDSFYTMGIEEPQISLYPSPIPIWSPDGDYIVCGRSLYYLAGGRIILPDKVSGRIVSISNDGNLFYFAESQYPLSTIGLFAYNRITGAKTHIIEKKSLARNPKVSPDGNWVSYLSSKQGLVVFNLKNKNERILASLPKEFLSPGSDENYCFSPDSKAIYIGYGGKIHRINLENGKNEEVKFIARVKVDIGPRNYNLFKLTLDSVTAKYIRNVRLSPIGDQLVFSAFNRLYIKSLPNSKPKILCLQSFGQFQPAWSRDGKWIAYVTQNDSEGSHVWRVSSSGGIPERLTSIPGNYQHPEWSPDGKMIVLESSDGKQRIDTSVSGLKIIVINGKMPSFSSDGTKLIFQPFRGRAVSRESYKTISSALVSSNLDGSNVHELALFPGIKQEAVDHQELGKEKLSISPDGQFLVYWNAENLHLIPIVNLEKPQIIFSAQDSLLSPVIRFACGAWDPHWEEGGKFLSWTSGNSYCRVSTTKIVKNAELLRMQRPSMMEPNNYYFDAIVEPDQLIHINVTASRHCFQGTIVLKNARIITMNGHEVIENGGVIVKDGKFIAIYKTKDFKIPRRSKVLDLRGKTIMPGLVDIHNHISSIFTDIFPQQVWRQKAALAYGVTTARDPSSSYNQYGVSELIETGLRRGPRLFTAGGAISTAYNINSLDEARVAVHNRVLLGGIHIKQYMLPTRIQRQWLLLASQEAGLNMTNEGRHYWEQLAMIKDGCAGIEHFPNYLNTGYDMYNDMISLYAASGTYLAPTVLLNGGPSFGYFQHRYGNGERKKLERFYDTRVLKLLNTRADTGATITESQHRLFATIRKRGGNVAMDSHGDQPGIGSHYAIWALYMGGINNWQALQCATMISSGALGLQNDIGSIEVGKIADLIVLDKNPLEDIHNTLSIKYVMKDGVLYNDENLDIVWPIKKKLLHKQ